MKRFPLMKFKPTFKPMLLLIFMSALGVFPLDVILPSIPSISNHFNAPSSRTSAGIALFAIIVALSQLVIGPASDKFGRKRIFLYCILFTIAGSVGCTFTKNEDFFYFFRFIQACGCGGFVLLQAFVQDIFTPTERIKKRILLTSVSGICISLSPVVGALLETSFGWPGSFYTFAILACLIFFLGKASLPSSCPAPLFTGANGDTVQSANREKQFILNSTISALAFASHFSFIILSPIIFLESLELSLYEYSVAMLFYGLAYVVGGIIASILIRKISAVRQVTFGLLIIATGGSAMGCLHYMSGMSQLTVITCAIISTCGVTVVRPACTNMAMEAMPSKPGTAASILNTITFIGGGVISFTIGLFASGANWLLPIALFTLALIGLTICILGPLKNPASLTESSHN